MSTREVLVFEVHVGGRVKKEPGIFFQVLYLSVLCFSLTVKIHVRTVVGIKIVHVYILIYLSGASGNVHIQPA